ncbi:MAG TPA: hypothetical protein VFM49_01010 [Chloroflexia bacterium]|nr:hypothetical protein [Chloroflexia bacterium]
MEIYNEEDGFDTWGGPYGSVTYIQRYAEILCGTYGRIRTFNSSIAIVMGGLAYDLFNDNQGATNGTNRYFFTNLVPELQRQDPVNGCTDAVNFHHYRLLISNWGNNGNIASPVAGLRRTMCRTNPSYPAFCNLSTNQTKRLIQTEGGISSGTTSFYDYSSPSIQASFVAKSYSWALFQDVKEMSWWDFADWNNTADYFSLHGLVTSTTNGSQPKLAYRAYYLAAAELGWPATQARRSLSSVEFTAAGGEGYSFYRDYPNDVSHGMVIAWNNTGGAVSVTLNPAANAVMDKYGSIVCQYCAPTISLPADGSPLYFFQINPW